MFSSRLRGFLYGVLITTSLVSVITYASGPDGVFGDYFERMIDDAVGCGANTAITGFDATPGVTYGTQECTAFDVIVRTVLGVGIAPSGQAVIGFDMSGSPVYGDVNWHKDGSENLSYTGAGNVGIGTNTPGATLTISGNLQIQDGTQGNGKVLTSDASGNASWQDATGGGGGGAAIWENVPLTDTNDFDENCIYRVDLGDIATSGAKYRISTAIASNTIFIGYNQVSNWIGDSVGKNSKGITNAGYSIAKIEKNCSGGTSGGGGGTAIWENVPLTDTNDFDVQCSYIFTAGGTTYRASYIKTGIIGEVSTLFDVNSTATWLGIKKGNKATLEMHQDNWSNNMIYGAIAVTSIKKSCSGGTSGPSSASILQKSGWPDSVSCYQPPAIFSGVYVLFTIRANTPTGIVSYYNTQSSYELQFNQAGTLISGGYGDCVDNVTTINSLKAAGRASYGGGGSTGFQNDCTQVSVDTGNAGIATATCPADRKIISGGCSGFAPGANSVPMLNTNSWYCSNTTAWQGGIAYAVCCK